ncbi:hypothetical protein SAMN05444380_1095 [Thermophagus xiamenensis]|uniref:Uncharacterized protein n=2 Tax=Thermophagus xiamenensis TaxID=385682 RepID=A0A1I1Z515_9BACT|nr:hypothetical protein SAMN05444380_1095 [Thermophagus xiamenensis]
MQPSIGAAKKIAKLVSTTVGYLLGETDKENILKAPEMLKQLNEIEKMDNEDKGSILKVLDGFIGSAGTCDAPVVFMMLGSPIANMYDIPDI